MISTRIQWRLWRWTRLIFPWVLLAGLVVLPRFCSSYQLSVAIQILVYSMLALGLNITVGMCGLLDLGYVGFYGIGAYATAVGLNTWGLSFWAVVPFAVVLCATYGAAIGAPILRLTGDYFAIVTFGFCELVILVVRNWTSVTRGARGFPGIEKPWFFGHEFGRFPPTEFFYLILVLLVFAVLAVRRLVNSRVGRAWMAIREDEIAAEACGINLMAYKTLGFSIAAGIGGLAGAFYATYRGALHPSDFTFLESILILCMVVLGGLGSIPGSLLGATLLVTLQEVLRPQNLSYLLTEGWALARGVLGFLPEVEVNAQSIPVETRWIVYGVILLLMMRWRPGGLIPQSSVKAGMEKR